MEPLLLPRRQTKYCSSAVAPWSRVSSTVRETSPERYPTLTRYLASLPSGLGSFPDCRARAALFLEALRDRPVDGADHDLPPRLRELIVSPPSPEQWLSEVELHALNLCVFDLHFGSAGLDAFGAWNRLRNRRLLKGSVYAPLFWLTPPARLALGLQNRWSAFRRGTQIEVRAQEPFRLRTRLLHAPGLFEPVTTRGVAEAFCAAVEVCGGRNVRATTAQLGPTCSDFDVRWD